MRGLHGFDALPTRVVRYCDTVGITVPDRLHNRATATAQRAGILLCVCLPRARTRFGASARRVADGTRYTVSRAGARMPGR